MENNKILNRKRKINNNNYLTELLEMRENKLKETIMNISQVKRNIHPRRKPSISEKSFKCSCGRSYLTKETLYAHMKIKHHKDKNR